MPLSVLAEMSGREVSASGEWRCNFYRCGGKTDKQYSSWSPIRQGGGFHRPDRFGRLVFEGGAAK